MKIIKTDQKLYSFKGEVLTEGEDKKEITVGPVLSNIMGANQSNPSLSWQLGKKFATEDTVELKAEDVVFVKEAINSASIGEKRWLTPIISGQLIEILESADKK